jgi:FixJ family two-component response regulator
MNLVTTLDGKHSRTSRASADRPMVFVVDDDSVVRDSLRVLIQKAGWQAETFASAQEFLGCRRPTVASCLIIDVAMSNLDGLDLQKRIAIERPEMPIIFISDSCDVRVSVQAMKAGALDFLTKPFSDEAIDGAIRHALERSGCVLDHEAKVRALRDSYASLTPREREVMALVVSGLLNKQVGGELGISEITVKAHRGQVMRKMKAGSLPALVNMVASLGLATTAAW